MGMTVVETMHSRHAWDREAGLVRRLPDGESEDASQLRKDGEWLPVLEATEPEVGSAWVLMLNLRGDGVVTIRRTTPVVGVTAIDTSDEFGYRS